MSVFHLRPDDDRPAAGQGTGARAHALSGLTRVSRSAKPRSTSTGSGSGCAHEVIATVIRQTAADTAIVQKALSPTNRHTRRTRSHGTPVADRSAARCAARRWAHSAPLLLLKYLLRYPREARLMVLGTFDTELDIDDPLSATLAELGRERLLERRAVAPLDAAAVSQLVDARAGDEASPELRQIVYEGTGGNAFFILELRDLAESGAVSDADSEPKADIAAGTLAVPEGVKEHRLMRGGSASVGALASTSTASTCAIVRAPGSDTFGKKGRAWLATFELPADEREMVDSCQREADFPDRRDREHRRAE